MKYTFYLSFIILVQLSSAQSIKEEIDNDVWIPFTNAWEANDGTAYNSLHTDDIWRINPGRLLIGSEYKSLNLSRMKGEPKNSVIEFSFETRTNNGDNAYEVGYYRITSNQRETPTYYVGRFHVALKKVEGKWKIAQDWDTGEINGVKITPESVSDRNFIHFQ